jgi:hypothetical protein
LKQQNYFAPAADRQFPCAKSFCWHSLAGTNMIISAFTAAVQWAQKRLPEKKRGGYLHKQMNAKNRRTIA